MILQSQAICQASGNPATSNTQPWQQCLSQALRDPLQLLAQLGLDPTERPGLAAATADFALRVPQPFIDRMRHGDWQDPLLLQVLPQLRELDDQPGFSRDPLAEVEQNPLPGLIHKYQSRVLLIVSGGCAINCRYCFRRAFPYGDNNPDQAQRQAIVDYIRRDPSIKEVILSGGDPLVASDTFLANLCRQLAEIDHLTTLRVHTRLPVVIPQRITDELLGWLTGTRLKPVLVIHSNHPNEIDPTLTTALKRCRQAGVTLLNQSVLLKRINDNVATLAQLSEQLFRADTLPYYLHLLDKVAGAAHFAISEVEASRLLRELRHTLPGYLVPTLVKEEPWARSKTPIPCG